MKLKPRTLRFAAPAIALSLLVLAGSACIHIPAPRADRDTLVIGRVIVEASGWDTSGSADINGRNMAQVELSLRNIDSGETRELRSLGTGRFYSAAVPAGRWVLTKLRTEVRAPDRSSFSIWSDLVNQPVIAVQANAVNNIGLIFWAARKNENTGIQYRPYFAETLESFGDELEKSGWAGKRLVELKL